MATQPFHRTHSSTTEDAYKFSTAGWRVCHHRISSSLAATLSSSSSSFSCPFIIFKKGKECYHHHIVIDNQWIIRRSIYYNRQKLLLPLLLLLCSDAENYISRRRAVSVFRGTKNVHLSTQPSVKDPVATTCVYTSISSLSTARATGNWRARERAGCELLTFNTRAI